MVDGIERVGVELDAPTGKNNGIIAGRVYFRCAEKHGILVVPRKIAALEA